MFVKNVTKRSVEIETPAKINLFLDVLNKREDNFHNINSLFQAISIFDRLVFEINDSPEVILTLIGNKDIPTNSDNLIVKAFQLLQEKFDISHGLKISLEKNIPIAAGLAGGSSDAAATILACNILFDLELTYEGMAGLGLMIGSDLPFFFSSGQALVTGRGEFIQETDFPLDYSLIVIKPELSISTAESYRLLKRDLTKSKNPFKLGTCRTVESYITSLKEAGNDFERVQIDYFPELKEIKEELIKAGAVLARMSGTGPCVFGIFEKITNNMDIKYFNKSDWQVFQVDPISMLGSINI